MDLSKYNRFNTTAPTFFRLCQTNVAQFLALDNKLSSGNHEEHVLHEIKLEQDNVGLIGIVFAAMCVEAEIYDYAATHLGDRYVKDNLDKLDVIAKWKVIPELVAKASISSGGNAFHYLSDLVKARNRLVHAKSRPLNFDKLPSSNDLRENEAKFRNSVRNSYRAICYLAAEMSVIEQGIVKPFWYVRFDDDDCPPYINVIHAEAKRYATECLTLQSTGVPLA